MSSGSVPQADRCAHPACVCPVELPNRFCSTSCATTAPGPLGLCACSHLECSYAGRTALPRPRVRGVRAGLASSQKRA